MNNKKISVGVCGVYKLEDIVTGSVYVGSAVDIGQRWSNHLADLRNDRYRYSELQQAFNDNVNRVKFEVLEVCTEDERTEREKWYFDYVKKVEGWTFINRSDKAHTHRVKDTSNMRKAQTGHRNGNARLSEDEAKEIIYLRRKGFKGREIAEMYNISKTCVYEMGRTKWVGIFDNLEDKYNPNKKAYFGDNAIDLEEQKKYKMWIDEDFAEAIEINKKMMARC